MNNHSFSDSSLVNTILNLLNLSSGDFNALVFDKDERTRLFNLMLQRCREGYLSNNADIKKDVNKAVSLLINVFFEKCQVKNLNKNFNFIFQHLLAPYERILFDYELMKIEPQLKGLDEFSDGKEFLSFLKKSIWSHVAARHPFYSEFLAKEASRQDFKYYLIQETVLDPRFDDLLALIQIGTSGREKMELAKNYWDEMGNGDEAMVHSKLFDLALQEVGITSKDLEEKLLLESLESGNLSALLAINRSNYYKAIGYFGVVEYLVPYRFKDVIKGWKRCGLPLDSIQYHILHMGIDAAHAQAWFNNVIASAYEDDRRLGSEIYAGVMLRLQSSQRYLDEIYRQLSQTKLKPSFINTNAAS